MIDWQSEIINGPATAENIGFKPKDRKHLLSELHKTTGSGHRMAEILGVSHQVIYRVMEEEGLKRKTKSECRKGKINPYSMTQRVLALGKKFINNNTLIDICLKTGIDPEYHLITIRNVLKQHHIKYKTQCISFDLSVITRKEWEWLYFIYKSTPRIALHFGCSATTIILWMKRNGIKFDKDKFPWQYIAESKGFANICEYLTHYYIDEEIGPTELTRIIIRDNPHLRNFYSQILYKKIRQCGIKVRTLGFNQYSKIPLRTPNLNVDKR